MSPAQIEVLLRFWYDPNATKHPWSPFQRDYIRHCVHVGILTDSAVCITPNHDALRPYIDALCAVSEPFQKAVWTVEVESVPS
jgi:hypothetical protein